MSELRIFRDDKPGAAERVITDGSGIAKALEKEGILFERWKADVELAPSDGQEKVLAAYANGIDKLKRAKGYVTADVVRMVPESANRVEARKKFLNEHQHAEDEVRFFVEGIGSFYLHLGPRVYQVICERDDLISVPHNTKHWFDMGPAPRFTAIRLFTNPEGWVAKFTGETIADKFPPFGEQVRSV